MEKIVTVCFTPLPVVFDLDGTLIDSVPDIHAGVNKVIEKHAIAPLSLDQVKSFVGGGVEVLWQRIVAAVGLDPAKQPELVADFLALYSSAHDHTRLFPGTCEAIEVLAARGHPIGLCTNKPMAPTLAVLRHFGIEDLFGFIVAGDSLPERKPDPAPLRAAFVGLGANPDDPRGLYVGDSEYDAICAARLPVPFLLFTEGYRLTPVGELPHAAVFDDFSKLPQLVAEQVE